MIVAGGGGHAKEVIGVLAELNINEVSFFDDVSAENFNLLLGRFKRVSTMEEITNIFEKDSRFVLGVGNPRLRKTLSTKFINAGGKLESVISPLSNIGKYNVQLGLGLNIMTGAVITQDVVIGEGVLIHLNATIHHDTVIGEYSEISPGCHILGKVQIGNYCSIGAGTVILPGIIIGNNVVIGAGSVVTKNVDDNTTIKGVPAK